MLKISLEFVEPGIGNWLFIEKEVIIVQKIVSKMLVTLTVKRHKLIPSDVDTFQMVILSLDQLRYNEPMEGIINFITVIINPFIQQKQLF